MVDIPHGKYVMVVNWMSDLISRQAAIDECDKQYPNIDRQDFKAVINAVPSAEVVLQTPQTYGKSINPNTEIASDLISRQDAIEGVEELFACADIGNDEYDITYMLENLPSTDRPTEWVPVSERLPEKNGCYLVSTTGENNYIIDIAFYIEGMWHKASRIKAWMPLPEPYREDGEA